MLIPRLFGPLFFFLPVLFQSPTPTISRTPVRSPIVPAILGTWQAGTVWAVNRDTHRMHVDRMPVNPELSDNALMPYGQRIEFTNGYDKTANVAYWHVFWLLPLPPNACNYPFFKFRYTETAGVRKPDQTLIDMEFSMEIDSFDTNFFSPVGASKTGRIYTLRCGGNDEWAPEFHVSLDRQRMWGLVSVDEKNHYGLQEYHRIAPYKRR